MIKKNVKVEVVEQGRRFVLLAAISIFLPVQSFAVDYYMTLNGAGNQSGNNWDNARPYNQIETVLNNTMGAGDTLFLGSGDYYRVGRIKVDSAGTASAPKRVIGVDRGSGLPLLRSDWNFQNPAVTNNLNAMGIEITSGANNWVFQDIEIQGFERGVSVSGGTVKTGIELKSIQMTNTRHPMWFANVNGVLVEDCHAEKYSKHGYRLNVNCQNVTFVNCIADMSGGDTNWYDRSENFPFGFYMNQNVGQNIVFENCVARNHRKNGQDPDDYWNGDGYVIENGNSGVSFIGSSAFNNEDAGFDVKPNSSLVDCVAFENKRNFRLWNGGTITNSCSGYWYDREAGGGGAGIWVKDGTTTITDCTVHGEDGRALFEDGQGSMVVNNSILSLTGAAGVFSNGAGVISKNNVTEFRPGSGTNPNYVNAQASWDGIGDDMNSQTFGETRGYYQDPNQGSGGGGGGGGGSTSLYIEAEDNDNTNNFAPFTVFNSGGSGGQHIESSVNNWDPDNNSNETGLAEYNFSLASSGNVDVWVRYNFPSSTNNSFWFQMDNGAQDDSFKSNVWSIGQYGANGTWTWTKVKTYNDLSSGNHTFRIMARERLAKIDRIFITTDGSAP